MTEPQNLVGRRVRLTWTDCCTEGEIIGVLVDYTPELEDGQTFWGSRDSYVVDGVTVTASNLTVQPLDPQEASHD